MRSSDIGSTINVTHKRRVTGQIQHKCHRPTRTTFHAVINTFNAKTKQLSTLLSTIRIFSVSEQKIVQRRVSAADRLLGLRVRIPPGAWMSVCCKCCVLSDIGLCDEPIPHPEQSYRMWCVILCNLQTSRRGGPRLRWAVAPDSKKQQQQQQHNDTLNFRHCIFCSSAIKTNIYFQRKHTINTYFKGFGCLRYEFSTRVQK
jgi:hypothetical protein